MFKARTFAALALLVVAGGLAAWKLTRPDPHRRDPGASADKPPVAAIAKDAVDELEITEPEKPPVHLKKEGGQWKLLAPVADKADAQSVEAALATLSELRWRAVIAENPASYEKLGLGDKEAVKVVAKQGGKPLATIWLGKAANARGGDDARVWATRDLRRWALVREPRMWRDREIAKIEADKLTQLSLDYGAAGKVVLKKGEAGKWTYVEGAQPSLDEQAATDLASTLARLEADAFVDEPLGADKSGLEPPALTLTATADGKSVTILFGKADDNHQVVKRADGPRVWKIAAYVSKRIPMSPAQWQDKQLTRIAGDDVTGLEITKGADKAVLARDAGGWKGKQPADLAELDPQAVEMLAGAFTHLRGVEIVEKPDAKAMAPTGSVAVTSKDGKTVKLLIGSEVKAKKAYHAQVEGKPTVYLVSDYVVNQVLKTPAELKKKATAQMPPM